MSAKLSVSKRVMISVLVVVVSSGLLVVCFDRGTKARSFKHAIEITITGAGATWTNADGSVWTELYFTNQTHVATPSYE